MKGKQSYGFEPVWPSREQVHDMLAIGERAIEAHQAQAVRLTRDLTLGAVTPKTLAEETQAFYTRLSDDWASALRVLLRRTNEREER